MTLRTPRRRISPRTKRRYRAIKGFFKRALGNSSQLGTKTSSSIEVSVSDLKSKINCIEEQLNSVSKHCQDLNCLGHALTEESANSLEQFQRNVGPVTSQENNNTIVHDGEAKLLYKASSSQHRASDESYTAAGNDDIVDMASANQEVARSIQDFQSKRKNIKLREKKRDRKDIDLTIQRKVNSKYKKLEAPYSSSSFHSLVEPGNKNYSKPSCSSHRHEKKRSRKEYTEAIMLKEQKDREALRKLLRSHEREFTDKPRAKKTKRVRSEIDQDFIADIIKKQYRPVKLFGRRDSDFSQFSAPVCRDQEFTVRDQIQEGVELCSCCFDNCRRRRNNYVRHTDLSDMRSICDTRLYSSKRSRRHDFEREYDDYNNSAYYDVVPVKEKSSPKTRRKFAEDNMIAYQCCKEVPPSPRSNRPRLNLKVQHYADYDENMYNGRHQSRRNSPAHEIRKKVTNVVESDVSSESYPQRPPPEVLSSAKFQKPFKIHEDVRTLSSLQDPNFTNEQVNIPNNDTTLNTQLTDSIADKTDKTLCEIKDILRTFLLEIKKESTCSDKTDGTSKIENKQFTEHQVNAKTNSNIAPNNGYSFNNYSAGQCVPPFMPAYPNPCCYPVLPVCPMNCVQNGYIIPTPSYTCNVCAKASKEHTSQDKDSHNKSKPTEDNKTNNETQELIKEIHKFVSQNHKSLRKIDDDDDEDLSARSRNERLFGKKFVTNRYVGGSRRPSKHDAYVGTPHLKCYSRSCEALGSKIASDPYTTSASYSETILEKLSLEATHSSTDMDSTADVAEERVKRVKLTRKFNPLRLFRKKKDVIEELSESESTVEVEVKPKPPFQQRIQSYTMHGQEFYHPPPIPPQHCCAPPHDYGHGYPQNCCQVPPSDFHNHHKHHHDFTPAPQYNPEYPTAPSHPSYNPYNNQIPIPPQVPLCLKEIEVKSIGTQSDRKVSIFQKFTKKIPVQQQKETPLRERNWKNLQENAPTKEKTSFWKSLQERARQNDDTMNYSLNTRKQLEQGDMNIRNAMMKKLFFKRNPFSPRNLIVRTLLGKDKSSYGNPPKMYRPRMFM